LKLILCARQQCEANVKKGIAVVGLRPLAQDEL
jgi:hypothetical protein